MISGCTAFFNCGGCFDLFVYCCNVSLVLGVTFSLLGVCLAEDIFNSARVAFFCASSL